VQLPVRYPFILNLKTARAIGLDIPANVLALAHEVKSSIIAAVGFVAATLWLTHLTRLSLQSALLMLPPQQYPRTILRLMLQPQPKTTLRPMYQLRRSGQIAAISSCPRTLRSTRRRSAVRSETSPGDTAGAAA
jgi:hypothetical protein